MVFGTHDDGDVILPNMTSQAMDMCGATFCAMDAQNESIIAQPSQTEVILHTLTKTLQKRYCMNTIPISMEGLLSDTLHLYEIFLYQICYCTWTIQQMNHVNLYSVCPLFQINTFTGFCVGVSVCAILLILIFLTNLASHSQPNPNRSRRKDVLAKVSGVVRLLLTSRDQQLLVPLTVVGGITMAFIAGDFTVVRLLFVWKDNCYWVQVMHKLYMFPT